MEKEILDPFFSKIDTRQFDRSSLLLKLLLSVSVIFLITDVFLWYRIYINSFFIQQLSFKSYLLPFTIFTVFMLLIISWSGNLKGNQLLKNSIECRDGSLLNKGLRKIVYANLAALLALCCAIASALIEVTLH